MKNCLLRIGLACAVIVLDLWIVPCLRVQVPPIEQFVKAPCPMPVPEGFIEGEDIGCGKGQGFGDNIGLLIQNHPSLETPLYVQWRFCFNHNQINPLFNTFGV